MKDGSLVQSFVRNPKSSSEAFRSFYLSGNSSTSLPLDAIRTIIKKRNEEEHIQNLGNHSLKEQLLSPGDAVVVVQVHNRGKYLEGLIGSLSVAYGIEKVLLIFSHDVYDDNINSIIADIKFCKVMQIFYPFSLQLYPNSFPGSDPKDCPRDLPVSKAKEKKCMNAAFPDAYGHYREATYTQTKHHWFWKVNLSIKD
jgi:alpha-1,6-mannosyl-glycoprotein beta-1,2-N-acetylglucosaminyltransferase